MTTPPPSPGSPLPPELVDELLSADLDGELDTAAAELGVDPAGLRLDLEATPGIAERRAALRAARAAIAVAPMEGAARGRAVEAALAAAGASAPRVDELEARRRARARRAARFASVAAAAVLVLGIGAVVATGGSGDGPDTASESALSGGDATDSGAASPEAAAAPVELGDVTEPGDLRDAVAALVVPAGGDRSPTASDGAKGGAELDERDAYSVEGDGTAASETVGAPEDTAGAAQSGPGADDASDPGPGSGTAAAPTAALEPPAEASARAFAAPAGTCTSAKAAEFAVGPDPALEATATYEDRPVEIAVFTLDDGAHFVVVSDAAADCATLSVQTLRPVE